jgi:Rrf2 family protein
MRIAYELARRGDSARVSVGVLADSAQVPYDFARQIANRLARHGLLVSRRGSHGGFALSRPSDKITLFDVFEAMDETPTMSLCTRDDHDCSRIGFCPVHHGVWLPLDRLVEKQLKETTLYDCVVEGENLGRPADAS